MPGNWGYWGLNVNFMPCSCAARFSALTTGEICTLIVLLFDSCNKTLNGMGIKWRFIRLIDKFSFNFAWTFYLKPQKYYLPVWFRQVIYIKPFNKLHTLAHNFSVCRNIIFHSLEIRVDFNKIAADVNIFLGFLIF